MKSGSKETWRYWLICATMFFSLIGTSSLMAFTQDFRPVEGSPEQDSYEFRYLGSKVKLDQFHEHTGIFLFIWKGQSPIKILGYRSADGKEIYPFAEFGLHHKEGWQSVGEWCATGTQWIEVKPGQVITFHMGMGWLERDTPSWTVKGADKACMSLPCTGGSMVSDVFPLPL